MNPLRIFRRLRELEAATTTIPRAIAAIVEATADLDDALKIHASASAPCSRCGSVVDLRMRENGPRLMQHGVDGDAKTIIACDACISYAKRAGWRLAKIATASTEPAKEEFIQ